MLARLQLAILSNSNEAHYLVRSTIYHILVKSENGTFEKFCILLRHDSYAPDNGPSPLELLLLIAFQMESRAERYGEF